MPRDGLLRLFASEPPGLSWFTWTLGLRARRDCGLRQASAAATAEHRDDHGQPLRVDAGGDAPRHRQVGRRDERLDLEQDRPRPFERARDGGADLAAGRTTEHLRRIGNTDEARARHLEDAELVRRAESVLCRAQNAMRVVAIALELQDAVDDV